MHHKFCLIDDEVLMTGTLNWGNDRSSDHWNYVYVTSKPQLVEPVKKGFYQMWNDFSTDAKHISDNKHEDSDATVDVEDINNVQKTIERTDTSTPELHLM